MSYKTKIKINSCSEFQLLVFEALRLVPYGRVISYKDLARLAGVKSARAVGRSLATNPFPLLFPCHRVVSANRKIGGFQAGSAVKKRLLQLEDIEPDSKNRIPERFFIKGGAQ